MCDSCGRKDLKFGRDNNICASQKGKKRYCVRCIYEYYKSKNIKINDNVCHLCRSQDCIREVTLIFNIHENAMKNSNLPQIDPLEAVIHNYYH